MRRRLLKGLPLAGWLWGDAARAQAQARSRAHVAHVAHPAKAVRWPADPLASPSWPDLARQFTDGGPIVFSTRVLVQAPVHADDPLNVPVRIDAKALLGTAGMGGQRVRRIRVVADLNPVRHVLDFEPLQALPVLALRMRLEQASPVRALVQTDDGQWHVGGTQVGAAGGGCTAPGGARSDGSWQDTLGQVQARWFDNAQEGSRRLRLRVMHPMDTGLVPGVPAFYLETLTLTDARGQAACRLFLHEPVAENPLFTLEWPLATDTGQPGPWRVQGRDNNGLRIDQVLQS
ncbi:quinoprotein dehydrogenase-associated SoxYZ-like carrier [Aquabacterium lacunae]|uniref:Quinoprotein dehydrogenase-associated SoxYZ-like carrier n=2 Tax=Aquabacterium lacunae TaxID=2528630 RepID=A0A4Q9H4D1_9BURK|nr:quinoprotein dehydrogenase-associated SoxYZ-like carrier [Aquabacterium lacunae]